jgi:opacity protein-like surface antigen
MTARPLTILALGALALLALPGIAAATDSDSTSTTTPELELIPLAEPATPVHESGNGLVYLQPELENAGYHVSNDPERFKHRVSFSPAVGELGSHNLFAFRLGYSPNTWLGYEVSFGHNPASSLHALLHTFNVQLRYPLPWRVQPYATFGYGMMTVYPGQAINADPTTKNTLTYGGGLEFYIRDDVALRGELRGATVLGQELGTAGTVAYDYREYTIGFAFYRSLGR